MTPERQRIRIAEMCGWTRAVSSEDGRDMWIPPGTSEESLAEAILSRHQAPDYPNSLDAMHEAEKAVLLRSNLPPGQPGYHFDHFNKYEENLRVATGGEVHRFYQHKVITASAAERAEAFLKTLGAWEE